MAKKRGKAAGRPYARLVRHERNIIELMPDKGASCRASPTSRAWRRRRLSATSSRAGAVWTRRSPASR